MIMARLTRPTTAPCPSGFLSGKEPRRCGGWGLRATAAERPRRGRMQPVREADLNLTMVRKTGQVGYDKSPQSI